MPRSREGLVGFTFRMPVALRDQIAQAAKSTQGSMNNEMVRRLQKSFEDDDLVARLMVAVKKIDA